MNLNPEDVAERSDLTPVEKETYLRFDKESDRCMIHTGERGLMRRLLSHDEFEPREDTCIERDGNITQVEGTLPIGCLKIRERVRESGTHAGVISDNVWND